MFDLGDIKKINVGIDTIKNKLTIEKKIILSLLRLDKIDEDISGNKLFKLHFFLNKAATEQKKIITFGGAYSNHLVATAKACKWLGIPCYGIVRGEKPKVLSHTLLCCLQNGMQLKYTSRQEYKKISSGYSGEEFPGEFENAVIIPEGGYSAEGAEGASLISHYFRNKDFTHICCPVGTATTLAGLIKSSLPSQKIIGFNALKGMENIENRIELIQGVPMNKNYSISNEYHFGGYAKKTEELITFMNTFHYEFGIPLDFVYTGKMMFGVFASIEKNYFLPGSKILCIHTGGLQGNMSLPAGALNF